MEAKWHQFSRRHIGGVVSLPILAAALAGCLFDPRSPAPPTSGESIPYVEATSPSAVWENCRLSLVNTDATGWDNATSSDFRYTPDSETVNAYPAVDWGNWGKDQELNFINNWYGSGVTIVADLLNFTFAAPGGSAGRAEWDIIYYIQVTDQSGSTTRYRGRATLLFTLPATYWQLTEWRDETQESDPLNPQVLLPTLGVVRAVFSG